MNLPAIEKMNKNKELADKIGILVDEWLRAVAVRCNDYNRVPVETILTTEWTCLQSRIERLLGEE